MRILLVGMSHRSAPLALRERLAVEDPAPVLQKLVRSEEIDEAVLFSTCNRVEIVVVTRSREAARLRLRACFAQDLASAGASLLPEELEDHLYEHVDGDAMRHVLRVASSLDSMVVGEPQILGQTKEAYQRAVECGAAGPILGRLFQHAFATAKRVRTETRIAERPVSVARVAVDLARQIFESFDDKQALLVGAGIVWMSSGTATRFFIVCVGARAVENFGAAWDTTEQTGDYPNAWGLMAWDGFDVGFNEAIGRLWDAINKARPSGAKGVYIKRIVVNATMGPGIKIDPNAALSVEATE